MKDREAFVQAIHCTFNPRTYVPRVIVPHKCQRHTEVIMSQVNICDTTSLPFFVKKFTKGDRVYYVHRLTGAKLHHIRVD
jgi:hypothetical protein